MIRQLFHHVQEDIHPNIHCQFDHVSDIHR